MERRRCAVNDVSKSECNHAGTTGKTRPVPNHVLKIHNTITGSSGDHSFLMSVHVVQSRLRNPAKCIAKHSKAGHRHVLDPFPAASSNTRNQKKAASVDKRKSLFRPELNHSKPRGQEGRKDLAVCSGSRSSFSSSPFSEAPSFTPPKGRRRKFP
jgi:hypothetical protein